MPSAETLSRGSWSGRRRAIDRRIQAQRCTADK
jgi:hypothetical protein